MSYYDDVYELVQRIPHGKVSTYGRIAQLTPVPRGARGVGWALAGLAPDLALTVPWWRVINAAGRISNALASVKTVSKALSCRSNGVMRPSTSRARM